MAEYVAIERLEAVFRRKMPERSDVPLVGVFGNGLPYALITDAGCRPVDVKAVPAAREDVIGQGPVAQFLEPFLDDYTRYFVNRFAEGDFDSLAAIVFPRDDAAALASYQYALELRRQAVLPTAGPKLVLWNLVHGRGAPIEGFNRRQAERLAAELAHIGRSLSGAGHTPATQERVRGLALQKLDLLVAAVPPRISGAEAHRWRNAGRYLDAYEHAALVDAACDAVKSRTGRGGLRIGLIGTALDDPRIYDAIESAGTVVCDLQPFGSLWPGPSALASPALIDVVNAEAGDPLAPRARPELAPLDTLVSRLVDAKCDLAIAQYDQNDDTFGWDLPALRRRLEARRIRFVDLGFRDHRPTDEWLAGVAGRIKAAMETANV